MQCGRHLFRAAALVGLILAFSGCGQRQSDLELLTRGPLNLQHIDPANVVQYAAGQAVVFKEISKDAGFLDTGPVGADQWKQFVTAAFGYADGQCEDYIEALRRLDIMRRQTTQQLTLVGAATAGILGVTQAASAAIAITAVAFGLASATVDNFAGSLLYELPPSEIGDLVGRLKVAYTNALTSDNWQSRAASFRTIRGYVQYCLPATIEANIKKAIAVAAPRGVASANNALGAPPSVDIPGGGAGPPATGKERATANPGPTQNERIESARGEENFIPSRIGRRVQVGLCLVPDINTVTFGPKTRTAIASFRATPKGRQLSSAGGTRSAPEGLSAEEISFLVTQQCDASCYSNAYEYYQFGSPTQLDDLLERLMLAKPGPVPPKDPKRRLCDARELVRAVQGEGSNGILTPDFVKSLPKNE